MFESTIKNIKYVTHFNQQCLPKSNFLGKIKLRGNCCRKLQARWNLYYSFDKKKKKEIKNEIKINVIILRVIPQIQTNKWYRFIYKNSVGLSHLGNKLFHDKKKVYVI